MWPHSENWHTSSLCFLQKINTNLSEPFTKHMYGVWEDCIVNINKCYYKYVPVYVSSDTCFSVNQICSYKRNYHTCNKLNLTFFTTIDKQLNGTDVSTWGSLMWEEAGIPRETPCVQAGNHNSLSHTQFLTSALSIMGI